MSVPATFTQITDYLKKFPGASPCWAEGLFAAKLSCAALESLVTTMVTDANSPLRRAEEGLLSKEIVKLNVERGSIRSKALTGGKYSIKIKAVLSPAEQTRVCRVVVGFCQPVFDANRLYSSNGHAVMNAVRRIVSGYLTSKIPVGASVVEVGPDVNNWMLSPTPSQWKGSRSGNYTAARPVIGPRDAVRVEWQRMSDLIQKASPGYFSDDVVFKAQCMREGYYEIFKRARIEDGMNCGEYITSYDSNYDIKFSHMPQAMALTNARAWFGVMVRAKGLSPITRLTSGVLDLMGVHYRVDWEAGRIDFRHPDCRAFGYSHDVWEYMKYEQHNGYVWTTTDCHYIYSKAPETTDELLFFQVVRVPKVHRLQEPRFVEHPQSGLVELTSIWAVGDEINGVPHSFEAVKFHVDALNFSKVLEKRCALDYKGDLAVTVSLVRSTNVRMWLHGTPVGVNARIQARLADATAVVVEALAAEGRLVTNDAFNHAMYQYDLSNSRVSWFRRMLEDVIDMQAVTGKIAQSVMSVWQTVRVAIIDRALSPLSLVKVGVRCVEGHKLMLDSNEEYVDVRRGGDSGSSCQCAERAEVNAAIAVAEGEEERLLREYYRSRFPFTDVCAECDLSLEAVGDGDIQVQADWASDASSSGSDLQSDTDATSVSCEETNESWRDEVVSRRPEAASMSEFVALEEYLLVANKKEFLIDATRIFAAGPVSDTLLSTFCTTRTKHIVLEFFSNRCVRVFGPSFGPVSALYDCKADRVIPVDMKGQVMFANVPNGYYYSCNNLKVWNGPSLINAVDHALSYGKVRPHRDLFHVTLGVPGAGKTRRMMSKLAEDWRAGCSDFLVLAVTKQSVQAAKDFGDFFGFPKELLNKRVMTLDSYLINSRVPASIVCFDEFPMVHVGKIDAAVSFSVASSVRLYGDGRQIPYDPFCSEFPIYFATLSSYIPAERVEFMPESHRLPADICAMWLDQYPAIYPCSCCRVGERERPSCEVVRVNDVQDLRYDGIVRFHTYKQDERDELRVALRMPGDNDSLRATKPGGLATVNEDQGSQAKHIITVRLSSDYDKNASPRNPSLYNRERYVLTDTTRHTESYKYYTLCDEEDVICKRVALSKDPYRRQLVAEKRGMNHVDVLSML